MPPAKPHVPPWRERVVSSTGFQGPGAKGWARREVMSASDGWSVEVLLRELLAHYRGARALRFEPVIDAEEIGAGRIDAMLSARDVAKRFTSEMDKTGICQAVVPVSGLLALTARIRPHFLFNSLNAVLSLIRSEPRLAEAALESLAELFRVLMRDPRDLGSGEELG